LPKNEVLSVELSLLVHATEDQDKVLTAVRNLFPPEHTKEITVSRKNLQGEYGNPISVFEAKIEDAAVVEGFLRNVGQNLPQVEKESLLEGLELRLTKGNLYLRLDKQAAFRGKPELCLADPIRLRIKFRTSKVDEITNTIRRLGLVP
jgi:RNA binding exosome subunit